MLRNEVCYLKLTLVVIQILVILSFTPACYILGGYGLGLSLSPITLLVLFVLHAYSYLESIKNRLPKLGHLVGVIALAFYINTFLYVISILLLLWEAYPTIKRLIVKKLDETVQ